MVTEVFHSANTSLSALSFLHLSHTLLDHVLLRPIPTELVTR